MRFLSSQQYRAVKSPSKYQALDDLLEIQANYYRSSSGQEYVADEVDTLIWAKADRADEQPIWENIYVCSSETTEDTNCAREPMVAGPSTMPMETFAGVSTQSASVSTASTNGSMPSGKSATLNIRDASQGEPLPISPGLPIADLADQIARDVASRWPVVSLPDFGDIAA